MSCFAATVSEDEMKNCSHGLAISSGFLELTTSWRRGATRPCVLCDERGEHDDVRAKGFCQFHAHVAEATETDDANFFFRDRLYDDATANKW